MKSSPGNRTAKHLAPRSALLASLALLRQLTWRHARQNWRQSLTLVAILALGVASYLSIRLANRAAVAEFGGFHEALAGQSDWLVRAPAGPLDVALLPEIRQALGDLPAHLLPVVETSAVKVDGWRDEDIDVDMEGEAVASLVYGDTFNAPVLGVDLIALGNVPLDPAAEAPRAGESETTANLLNFGEGDDIWAVLRSGQAVWLTEALAQEWGVAADDALHLLFHDRIRPFRVQGVIPAGTPNVPERLALMDLPTLLAALDESDRIDRLEVILPRGNDRNALANEARQRLETTSDGRWTLTSPDFERSTGERMTVAFRLNLTILSLIALLIGIYLITQALDAAVVRRRQEIGILRSLGWRPATIQQLWLTESLLLGLVGTVAGVFLGWALAQVAVRAVGQTVNALYFTTGAAAANLDASDFLLSLALGVGGSLLAGWLPARDAASTPPAQVLASGDFSAGFKLFRRWRLGLVVVATGALLTLLPPLALEGGARFPAAGYGAAFAWMLGGTLVAGLLIGPVAQAGLALRHTSAPWHYALSRLRAPSSRHRLALAGLYIAVGMAAAISFLVGSFEQTMVRWIEHRFRADVYVASSGIQSASADALIREETWRALAARPEVAALDPFRLVEITLDDKRTYLGGSDLSLIGEYQQLLWLEGGLEKREAGNAQHARTPAIINEAFAARFQATTSDLVTLITPSGAQPVTIVGIQADYGNEQGLILIDRATLADWWGSHDVTNLSLFLQPGTDTLAFAESVRRAFPALAVRDNESLRATALAIFRQTFAITGALKYLGVFVALAGLALALSSILRENYRALATLRAMGFTRAEIARATAYEGLGLATAGLVAGFTLSIALGWLLINVINKQSFGWTLQWATPWDELAALSVSLLLLAGIVSYAVGWWGARLRFK